MVILSIDSAGGSCGACVWHDGKALAEAVETMERGQDQRLMPMILDVLRKADVEFGAIDRVAITTGPGSFTGLRIGLSAARGIGLAAEKPVIGIDRFSIFREQANASGKDLFVVINSKRKELFCRFFPASGSPHEPIMWTPEEIATFLQDKPNTVIAGDIEVAGHAVFKSPESEAVTCAALASKVDANDPAYQPRPLYLREPDVTIKPVKAAS